MKITPRRIEGSSRRRIIAGARLWRASCPGLSPKQKIGRVLEQSNFQFRLMAFGLLGSQRRRPPGTDLHLFSRSDGPHARHA